MKSQGKIVSDSNGKSSLERKGSTILPKAKNRWAVLRETTSKDQDRTSVLPFHRIVRFHVRGLRGLRNAVAKRRVVATTTSKGRKFPPYTGRKQINRKYLPIARLKQ